jgi:hypothetical protein
VERDALLLCIVNPVFSEAHDTCSIVEDCGTQEANFLRYEKGAGERIPRVPVVITCHFRVLPYFLGVFRYLRWSRAATTLEVPLEGANKSVTISCSCWLGLSLPTAPLNV